MKETVKTTGPVKQPMHPVREYFNEGISDAMSKMSVKEMAGILKELPNTQFWIAMLKYNQERLGVVQSLLFSGDPVKDPAGMARNQGIMLGLSDMQNAIIQLITPSDEENEGPTAE